MEKTRPTEHHRRLECLVGQWSGPEKIRAPHTTHTDATGTFDLRMALDGLFLVADYVERAGAEILLRGHGVIGWDPQGKSYTLHWFDTYGFPPISPGRGQLDGDALIFEHVYATKRGRTMLALAGPEKMKFKIEMNVGGEGWQTAVDGDFTLRTTTPEIRAAH